MKGRELHGIMVGAPMWVKIRAGWVGGRTGPRILVGQGTQSMLMPLYAMVSQQPYTSYVNRRRACLLVRQEPNLRELHAGCVPRTIVQFAWN